jgi:hypothetical protein
VTRKFSGGGALALLFFNLFLLFAVFPQKILYANSSQEKTVTQDAQNVQNKTLVRSEPAEKPEWMHTVPQSNTEFFFVGTSQPYDTAANARDNARESARNQVLKFSGEFIESRAIARASVSGSTRETLEGFINREDVFQSFAQNIVSEVSTTRYYTEVYLNSSNREEYVVYVLCQIGRQKAEDEIANFAKRTSDRYVNLLSQGGTLKSTLENYAFIAKSLEQNPLHRMVAYYNTPSGQAGLYEYVRLKIGELANSLTIEPIPARTIQETEKLYTLVKLRSSVMPSTGFLDCKATLFGTGGDDVIYPFITSSSDPINLELKNLGVGSYNVQLEILLSDLTGGIAKNTALNFSLDVTALNVYVETADAMEAAIKRAVDALASRLQAETETRIGPFFLSQTNAPSGLSRYLNERVRHYAINNGKYRITNETNEEPSAGTAAGTAALTGFFTRRNDRVDVIIELSAPAGTGGSQSFSLSTAELQRRNITIEPENLSNVAVLNGQLNNLPEGAQINIHARFNSDSMTYLHYDQLEMTLTADRDCYFKVLHIDVNNNMKLVYPTRNDTNNELKANVSRNLFETRKYFLYEPYGTETIIVVASYQKFKDIELEYNAPWTAVTEAALKEAVAGAGQAQYRITILKPHEEYEFKKPQNMIEACQAIYDDVARQGGKFNGDTAGGFYTIGNIRGSYRVSGDRLQFATYYLDNFTRGSNTGIITRGQSFNFSFAKPQNITNAVQTVRSGIESKGGTFSGNEQQGDFRSSGIAGRYQVSDRVNVTISEKPFIVPNSLIENEVKNYFGVR